MKIESEFGNTFISTSSYEFSLFPMIAFGREKWVNNKEFMFCIGLWFWYWEISVIYH
jgi:hypothetical protein